MKLGLNRIGPRLFLALAALCVLFSGYALWSHGAITRASDIVVNTYDGPMQALNYARSADADFNRARMFRLTGKEAASRQALELFREDIAIASERALSETNRRQIAVVAADVERWAALGPVSSEGDKRAEAALAEAITAGFDVLTETMAADSFLERQVSVENIAASRRFAIAAAASLVILSVAIGAVLSHQIVRPLTAAAAVARRISEGDLGVEIPKGGADETGALLRSMQSMQTSIQSMIAREEARANSAEARMIGALDYANAGVIVLDEEGRIAFANDQVFDLSPRARARVSAGEDASEVLADLKFKYFAGGEEGESLIAGLADKDEFRIRDGRWLKVARSEAANGETLIIWTDITALKDREEALRVAMTRAEAASAAKSRFLSTMSHELKTPLNAVIGFADIIHSEAFGPLGGAQYKDYAKHILNGGRRLLELLQQVLEIANGEDDARFEKEPVDVADAVDSAIDTMAADGAAHGVTIDNLARSARLTVAGDARLLARALSALVSNAVKFSPEGARVEVSARDGATSVEIVIADKGVGMSPDEIPVALSPFDQVDGALDRRFEGAGLGLPFANSIIRRHGGSLSIDSAPGAGTTVTVRLPKAADAAKPLSKTG